MLSFQEKNNLKNKGDENYVLSVYNFYVAEITGILNRKANTQMTFTFFTEGPLRECICANIIAPTTVTMGDDVYADFNVVIGTHCI